MKGGAIMPKSNEELATEITVAWLNAVGRACETGKFNGSWLQYNAIGEAYQAAFNAIIDAEKNYKNSNQ